MNKSDSERIASLLEKDGYKPALKTTQADLVIINMCSVRQSAVDRVNGLLPKIKNLKAKIVLTGCVLKKDEAKFKKRGWVDEVWNNKDYLNIIPKNSQTTFVPISNGCNNNCSYCVVPLTRGRLSCRSHEKIIKEVKDLANQGHKEIWLLGQSVNDYFSSADLSVTFAELLKKINNIPGKFSLRFMSPHPKNFSQKLIEVMAQSDKVAKYIHLPVQSGDNSILKKMKRDYTVVQYKKLVKRIKEAMPDINLTTDVIVGFPGETKKQFENTLKLFKDIKFNLAYISKYSPRPGTSAFQSKDDVPLEEKKRREQCLRNLLSS